MVSKNTYITFLSTFLLMFWFSVANAQFEEPGASNSLFYYTGTLGNAEKIEFNIQLNGHIVTGSCILVDSGDLYIIKGRLAADKSGVGLLIYNDLNIFIASVEAKVISEDFDFARQIKGVWKPAKNTIGMNLVLSKVAELASAKDTIKRKIFF
jgi:hypothetical protein